MDGLLTPVSTTYKGQERKEDALIKSIKEEKPVAKASFHANTPIEALEILKHEPDYETLTRTLRFLVDGDASFNITSPSPITSQLIHVIVTNILPSYWSILLEGRGSRNSKQKKPKHLTGLELLLKCLRSVTGLNALLLALKRNIQLSKDLKKSSGINLHNTLTVLLQALEHLLEGSSIVEQFWRATWKFSDAKAPKKVIWAEFLGLIAGGKLLGNAAEAEDVINSLSNTVEEKHWVADGNTYGTWLAKNVYHWAKSITSESEIEWKCCAELLTKSFRVGKTEKIITTLLESIVLRSNDNGAHFVRLLDHLPLFDQRNVVTAVLQTLAKEHLPADVTTEANSSSWKADSKLISGAAGLVKLMVVGSESRKSFIIAWTTSSTGAGVGEGIPIRRAVLAVVADDKSNIDTIFEKSIAQFGDQLYIRHTPTIQQEVHTQVLLLCAGYVHRQAPLRLSIMMRSGIHLNGVSNRLASSSQRARFLGMVVAEALSSLVDKGDNKMDFKVEDMQTAEAEWYKSLVNVQDTVGSVEVLSRTSLQIVPKPMARSQAAKRPIPLDASRKVISIKEIDDDEESAEETDSDEDDDLVPYGKPDSDAEDSDEDAANVVRNKPTAPVYIRNLITYLRDTENYDRQKLGLSTAASLIRRKADFGTEVSAHAEELATLLVGIQDKYEIEDFQKLRLQGMVAILVALPAKMGQWFARTFFEGDYSVSQRASVLTTLGLGAREIGGFGKEDTGLTKTDKLPNTSFPSKALPPAMHSLYITPSTKAKPNQPTLPFSAISTLTTSLTNALTQPIAASALASTSGPALMNLTPLSTRQITTPRMRPKLTTNTLSPILPTSFFFPLTGRFFIHLRSNPKNIIFTPPLLPLFLKTLALILDSSGPNTPSLPQLTSEFWDLLLTLRTQATTDISILEALLFAFLILLEINGDQRELVQAHGRQLLETQEWVENVFEKLGRATGVSLSGKRGGGSEEEKVRALAASVLVRIRECVEKYQMVLMGDMASFS